MQNLLPKEIHEVVIKGFDTKDIFLKSTDNDIPDLMNWSIYNDYLEKQQEEEEKKRKERRV